MLGGRLALDLESDLGSYLKFLDRAVHDAATLLHHLKPIHVPDALRRFCDPGLDGFRKAQGRSSHQFDNFYKFQPLVLLESVMFSIASYPREGEIASDPCPRAGMDKYSYAPQEGEARTSKDGR